MNSVRREAVALTSTKSSAERLEESRTRYRELTKRQTAVQIEIEAAARQLEEALAEAEREYGTRDLDALRALYARREAENERALVEFVAELDALERSLKDVERELAS